MKKQVNHCILHPHKLICYKCTWTSCSEVHIILRHSNGWRVTFIPQLYKACREKHRAYMHWYGRLNCHLEKNPYWTMLNHHTWLHVNVNLNSHPNLNLNPSFYYTEHCLSPALQMKASCLMLNTYTNSQEPPTYLSGKTNNKEKLTTVLLTVTQMLLHKQTTEC